MADISKINVDGTQYDICDDVARGRNIPGGGRRGQALVKNSDDSFDATWQTIEGGGGGTVYIGEAVKNNIGSATAGTAISADDITSWSAGSAPTLGTAIPADDITAWSAGSAATATVTGRDLAITSGTAPSLSYTAKSIPNVTDVGSAPTLQYTARTIPNITVTSTSVVTDIEQGDAPSGDDYELPIATANTLGGIKVGANLSINSATGVLSAVISGAYSAQTTSVGSASAGTAINADNITSWSAGSVPTLGTAIAADDITSWSAGTLPNASVENEVLTLTFGTLPSLAYSACTIPNVTSVGSAPSLQYSTKTIPNISVTPVTVVTGITAS